MLKIQISLIALSLTLTGCVTKNVTHSTVRSQTIPTFSKICIQGDESIPESKKYLDIIASRFNQNGINTSFFLKTRPADCKYSLTFNIKTNWDGIPFISRADLYLFDNGLQIHTAQYKVTSTFDLAKWGNSQSKLEGLVDQLSNKKPFQK